MGIFARLFGGGVDKGLLVKQLFRIRFSEDPTLGMHGHTPSSVDRLPYVALMGLPEATLVTIVETWVKLTRRGLSAQQIVHTIESHRGPMPLPPADWTLATYTYSRLLTEHGSQCNIPERWVVAGIKHCLDVYT